MDGKAFIGAFYALVKHLTALMKSTTMSNGLYKNAAFKQNLDEWIWVWKNIVVLEALQ